MVLWISERATEESFYVEDGVARIQDGLGFGSIADEAVSVGEGHARWRAGITLVVGDDFNAIVVPYGYTAMVPGAVSRGCDSGADLERKLTSD